MVILLIYNVSFNISFVVIYCVENFHLMQYEITINHSKNNKNFIGVVNIHNITDIH